MFESLGLTDRTITVYRECLQNPRLLNQTGFSELGEKLELPADEVAAEIDHLRNLGLVVPRWNIADEEYPLHPSVAFERLAARRQQEIDDLAANLKNDQVAANQFVADYSDFLVERTARDIEVLEGRERAHQRMQDFQPTKSSWGMVPASKIPSGKPSESPDQPLLERGIDTRYLFPESGLKIREIREVCEHLVEYGAKVRTAASVPMRLIIFDGDTAVMGIDPDDTSVGAVVHHSKAVVRLAQELFLHYWKHADDPFSDGPSNSREISSQEAEFLSLLVQGATDEQVGRKLGVSMRTVRRMAAKLSEQVGASGRFELGVRAAQRGWVK
ncbi:regulatory LuxR family protein [Kribbella antiqua]|uniref:Regulatory LuxR family protein n=1 Tax=Kribbella antiqua TaxID=2512217 RepID=A0A4R2IQM8_9ACTN|nr:LuxR C-terminal-related transcriptional regulator [Kribbella antiqua]TCO47534.1 regulatory LuxR family protein [Kribbella antiqua]